MQLYQRVSDKDVGLQLFNEVYISKMFKRSN